MHLHFNEFIRSVVFAASAGIMSLAGMFTAYGDNNTLAGYGLPTEEVEEFMEHYDGPLNFLDMYFPAVPSPFQIRIRFDDQYEELTTSDTKGWRVKRGESYEWDDEKVLDYFTSLKEKYDSPVGVVNFTDHTGTQLVFETQNCGWHMHLPFSVQRFKDAVDAGETVFDPAWNSGLIYSSKSDVGMKYVEVDISEQTVYLFENGELILETPCVTGKPTEFAETHTGVFQVIYKASPSVLKGEEADGTGYEQPVDYWIAFNGSQGLHDAPWRSQFGGDIYLSNGSHGCVNLPPEMAANIYKEVYPMYPVIVHE